MLNTNGYIQKKYSRCEVDVSSTIPKGWNFTPILKIRSDSDN